MKVLLIVSIYILDSKAGMVNEYPAELYRPPSAGQRRCSQKAGFGEAAGTD